MSAIPSAFDPISAKALNLCKIKTELTHIYRHQSRVDTDPHAVEPEPQDTGIPSSRSAKLSRLQ